VTRMRLLTLPIALVAAVGGDTAKATTNDDPLPAVSPAPIYHGASAKAWAKRFRRRTRQLQQTRHLLRRRWRPTVVYSLRLASAVSGLAYRELEAVAACESTLNPFAANGRYKGLFQLGWAPFGMSPFDPVANSLSAALTARRDGGWRQWECRP
jgi:hypothetical protein